MGFRRLASGLLVTVASLLLAACQGASTRPPEPATAAPVTASTFPPSPTAAPTLLPNPTEVPASPGTTEGTPSKTVAPASSDITQPESTLDPNESQQSTSNDGHTGTESTKSSASDSPTRTGGTRSSANNDSPSGTEGATSSANNDGDTGTEGATSGAMWSFNGTAWSPNGTPPSCAEPFVLQTPVDMNIVTSALWPGQVRGGYKGHGGFRFDENAADGVTVRAPIGSHLVQAAWYLEGDDEQYLLFFSVPCGFFYRFDHVRVVPAKLSIALKDIPAPTSGDSRTTFISPPLWVEQGEIVGTSVGIAPSNIFIDFGLYDVRKPNDVTPNAAWADLFAGDIEFGQYGVCFFDYLPGNDGEIMRSFPTGKEGKTSDYCD